MLKYVQGLTYYQAGSGNIVGATTITLTTLTDIYGNVLTMTDFGAKGYGSCEPDTNNEEAFTFTGISANPNGTYTLTGVQTALAKSPYTESSALIRQHAGGTKVVITDNVAFWNTFTNKKNDETIVGNWIVPNTSDGNSSQIATFDDIANAITGVSGTASDSVFGTVKLSVAAVSLGNPIVVGNNDPRVTTPLVVSLGGTGHTSLTAHAILAGGTTSTALMQQLGLGTTTQVLHGNASGLATFGSVVLTTDVTGILPEANGGTGSSTLPFRGLFKNGTTTKDAADATVVQNIAHGLGVIPKKVKIRATIKDGVLGGAYFAETVYNGTTQSSYFLSVQNTNSPTEGTSFSINAGGTAVGYNVGVVTFDVTNIIITWTNAGSSTSGIFTLLWEAEA